MNQPRHPFALRDQAPQWLSDFWMPTARRLVGVRVRPVPLATRAVLYLSAQGTTFPLGVLVASSVCQEGTEEQVEALCSFGDETGGVPHEESRVLRLGVKGIDLPVGAEFGLYVVGLPRLTAPLVELIFSA